MAVAQGLIIGNKEYISFAVAKGYLRCTESTLQEYIAQGKLKLAQVERHAYVELESMQNLMTDLLARR